MVQPKATDYSSSVPMTSPLSLIVPFYDDFVEALSVLRHSLDQVYGIEGTQGVLLAVDPARAHASGIPQGIELVSSDCYKGLPAAKNAALRVARGDMVLFLSPPLMPRPGAIGTLVEQLQSHPECGAVCGQWRNSRDVIEKGYNARSFPTLRALCYDLLFLNKLRPGNRCTRRYKMHDFDHQTASSVEHAPDYAFLARRQLLLDLGGFDETYRFGWFEQVEICTKIIRAGYRIGFEPSAVFSSGAREPIIDRLLADHYCEFYFDQERFAVRNFGIGGTLLLRILLIVGMLIRLAFSMTLPGSFRRRLLGLYRSYVNDGYIRSMTGAYRKTLRKALSTPLERAI